MAGEGRDHFNKRGKAVRHSNEMIPNVQLER